MNASLPSVYALWLGDLLGGSIPAETRATCESCVMLPPEGSAPSASFFSPVTKCCTYQPTVPNFLAGRILADRDPELSEGRASLERRIHRRVGVGPLGVVASGAFRLMYVRSRDAFGRAPGLKCPHLTDAGDCGIWRHRPAVCSTWFCKHVRGETASRFWSLTNALLHEVEAELAIWCASEMRAGAAEFDVVNERTALDRPEVEELDGPIDERRYARVWGEWRGRELEYYEACARLVEPLDWRAVRQVCGPRVRVREDLVRDAYEHLTSDAIPAKLRLGTFQIVDARDGKYWLVAYSPYDPLVMPERLAAVLPYFDGRPTAEALTRILVERNVRVEMGLVRRMVDFGLLQPA